MRLMGKSASSLVGASESPDLEPSFRDMLRLATNGSHTPQAERGRLQFGPHQMNHLPRSQPELTLDGIKAGPIFPGHLDHPVKVGGRKIIEGSLGHPKGLWRGSLGFILETLCRDLPCDVC
jgi:hypothetical protein